MATSIDDVAKNLQGGSDKLKNVSIDRDDDFMQVTGEFDGVEIGLQGTFSVKDGVMTIDGVDFAGEVGVRNIRPLVKEFGTSAGVNQVNIIPARRTTGANPGKKPNPFTVKIEND